MPAYLQKALENGIKRYICFSAKNNFETRVCEGMYKKFTERHSMYKACMVFNSGGTKRNISVSLIFPQVFEVSLYLLIYL